MGRGLDDQSFDVLDLMEHGVRGVHRLQSIASELTALREAARGVAGLLPSKPMEHVLAVPDEQRRGNYHLGMIDPERLREGLRLVTEGIGLLAAEVGVVQGVDAPLPPQFSKVWRTRLAALLLQADPAFADSPAALAYFAWGHNLEEGPGTQLDFNEKHAPRWKQALKAAKVALQKRADPHRKSRAK